MDKSITKFDEKIAGALGCFDRVLLKGHLPISIIAASPFFLIMGLMRIPLISQALQTP